MCCLVHRDSTYDLLLLQISSCVVWQSNRQLSRNMLYLSSRHLCFFKILNHYLFVKRDDSLTNDELEGYHVNRTIN